MKLSDSERFTLVNALMVARDQYELDAQYLEKQQGTANGNVRLSEQFRRQMRECNALIAKLQQ